MSIISVVVPVYNVEPYFRQCVNSILAQSFSDFELILIDDGSSDNCPAICDEYAKKDSRIRVIHKKNGGLSDARNVGIDIAEGQYLTFIDSDDWISSDFLMKLFKGVHENNADISVGTMIAFNDGENPIFKSKNGFSYESMSGREACLSIYHMIGKIPIMAWGKLYKHSLFTDIRYPVGRIHEDDATTPKLIYRAKKVTIINDDAFYLYRLRTNSIMQSKFSIKSFDRAWAAESCSSFFSKYGDNELEELSLIFRTLGQAKAVILANKYNVVNEIPEQYKMSLWRALSVLRRLESDDVYTWYLSQVYPKLEKPHSYVKKIEEILGIKKSS